MATLTVRNLPDDVYRALRARATKNGRSTEAEVREILSMVVKPAACVRMGDALAALARTDGLPNTDVDVDVDSDTNIVSVAMTRATCTLQRYRLR